MAGNFAAAAIIISVIFSVFCGKNIGDVSAALLNEPVNAAELVIYLCGGMCFWSGLMRVAEKAGIVRYISALLKKPLKVLFKNVNTESRAFYYICMNISANILGLGNAATPLGVEAVRELAKAAPDGEASDDIVTFTVMNTASLTLIPSTAASLRLKYGAAQPFDIMPAVLFTSALSLTAALIAAKAGNFLSAKHKRRSENKNTAHNTA